MASQYDKFGRPIFVEDGLAKSSVEPATNTIAAPGQTTSFEPTAGRDAYLLLSGGTSATGVIEYSIDGGTSWFQLSVEGNALGAISYVGAALVIPVVTLDRAGTLIRANFSAVSGSVTWRFEV
jgi:hypothetical protein